MWDLIRLMVSVTLKRDTEEETSGTFLRPVAQPFLWTRQNLSSSHHLFPFYQGVALSLRRGYEWGILNTDQAPVQMQRAEPFLPPGVIASNEGKNLCLKISLQSSQEFTLSTVEDQEAASAQFFQKRLAEMRQFAVDPSNLEVRTLAHSYLKVSNLLPSNIFIFPEGNPHIFNLVNEIKQAIGKEDEQDGFEIVEAGQLKNWNGRVRTLILLRQELKVLCPLQPSAQTSSSHLAVSCCCFRAAAC